MDNYLVITNHNTSAEFIRLLLVFLSGGVVLFGFIDYLIKRRSALLVEKYQTIFRALIKKHLEPDRNLHKYEWQPVSIPLKDFKRYNMDRKSIRTALVHTILELFASSSHTKRASLTKLYRDLDLELYTIMELKMLKGEDLALAIKELAEMDIVVEKHRMRKFLKHKCPRIRKITKTYFQKIYLTKEVDFALD